MNLFSKRIENWKHSLVTGVALPRWELSFDGRGKSLLRLQDSWSSCMVLVVAVAVVDAVAPVMGAGALVALGATEEGR